jgi:uroporphyrinogen-III synthase
MKILSTKQLAPYLIQKYTTPYTSLQAMDFIEISPLPITKSTLVEIVLVKDSHLIFTSSNAVAIIIKLLGDIYIPEKNLHIWCTDGRTYELVLQHFEAQYIYAERNSEELASVISNRHIVGNYFYFCGEKRLDTLPGLLNKHHIPFKEIVCYTTKLIPKKTEEEYDAVLFFSPSGVESFFSINTLDSHVICCAIGKTTAREIAKYCKNKLVIADESTPEFLITKVIDTYKQDHNDDTTK